MVGICNVRLDLAWIVLAAVGGPARALSLESTWCIDFSSGKSRMYNNFTKGWRR
jgi:hypothetical protein